MADGYIDLSPIVDAVNSAANGLNRQIVAVGQEVIDLRSDVYSRMQVLKDDLEYLKVEFVNMMEENRRQAALQRALTEIIRVRQELERDFGNYKVVRDTMIGILEATDLSLVRQTTITSCTEELMLATPRYWLAPVLIALAAWIADNKPLAIRALQEAVRRDEEKTCLTFALICRRNGRESACFKWLARYFAIQKANDMKESIIAYIDAYTNGVFGEDRDNLCNEYIVRWMNELQEANPNFEEQQVDYWTNQYQIRFCRDTSNQYPKLAECAKNDFAYMNAYVQRINAVPEIIKFFSDILGTEVDKNVLITAIDNELIKLVKNYDAEEAPLREEEEYLNDIKNNDGDEKIADALREQRKLKRIDRKVDLASRLSETITSNNREDISAKKTAIFFMQGYIKGAFKKFIEERASVYPQEITIGTQGWSGKTKGDNKKELDASYEKHVSGKREAELATVKNGGVITLGVFAVLCLVFTILGFAAVGTWLGVVGIIGLVLFGILTLTNVSKNKKKRLDINNRFDQIMRQGKTDIELCIKQMQEMNQIVRNFNATASCDKLLSLEEN